MTTDELIRRITQASRAGDWALVQPLFVELRRLMQEQGRPLGATAAAQLVDAMAEGSGLGANMLGAAGATQLIMRVRSLAVQKPLDRLALQTAWDSLYRLLADPTARIEQRELHDLMLSLRSGRVFDLLARAADRTLTRFPDDATARRLYGQALIDAGQMHAGIEMLESARRLDRVPLFERDELAGLLGRAYKQLYVDHVPEGAPSSVRAQFKGDLEKSIGFYASVYNPDQPDVNYWHGVNLIALLQLAQRHGHGDIKNPTGLEPEEIAKRIIDRLEPAVATTNDAWKIATLAECHLARHDIASAARHFESYLRHPAADAFALAGTVRQLEEVFRLSPSTGEGARILAMLKEAQIAKPEGRFTLDGDSLSRLGKLGAGEGGPRYGETMVPGGGFVKLELLQKVVRRAAGIAALCDETGATKGTGFLVRGGDLDPRWGNDVVLLSNSHVVSDPAAKDYESEAPLRPSTMQIVLEGVGNRRITCETRALWQSPIARHDAVAIRLTCSLPDGVQPLELAPAGHNLRAADVERGDAAGNASRVSVIGYPLGGPLSLSVVGSITGANGLLVDFGCRRKEDGDPRYLHYRAPTEPGNSGSPVFETDNWTVVGLHHEGFDQFEGRPKLDGKTGKTFANEGISIHSIARAITKK